MHRLHRRVVLGSLLCSGLLGMHTTGGIMAIALAHSLVYNISIRYDLWLQHKTQDTLPFLAKAVSARLIKHDSSFSHLIFH